MRQKRYFRSGVLALTSGIFLTSGVHSVWAQSSPMWMPRTSSLRYAHAMAYDSARDVTVLFGGWDGSDDSGETWEWDGSAWTLRATAGPRPRSWPAMAYDSARGVTVLFGGYEDGGNVVFDDTWEWDGNSWTQVATAGPSARFGHALAYDSARGVTVLFGGNQGGSAYQSGTWEWDGITWTLRTTTGPSLRDGHAMAYDSARQVVVLFGGRDGAGYFGDTWEWNGSTWSLPATSTTMRVSVGTAGEQAVGGGSDRPVSVSADGRHVLFVSSATNLVSGDDNAALGGWDVFVRDGDTDGDGIYDEAGAVATVLISAEPDGTSGDGVSGFQASVIGGAFLPPQQISGDGRFVVFHSTASDLVAGDTNDSTDAFIRDRDTDGDGVFDEPGAVATTRIGPPGGAQPIGVSGNASISGNGNYVAFQSTAGNLVTPDVNTSNEIYVWNRLTGAIARISISSAGTQPTSGSSESPSISADGRFVAFESTASTLVAGDSAGSRDIFVHDRDADGDGIFDEPGAIATRCMSVSFSTGTPVGASDTLSMSGDGRWIAFRSSSASLLPAGEDTNGVADVFLRDRDTDEDGIFDEPGAAGTTRVSVADNGVQLDGGSWYPAVSPDGGNIAFSSTATNVVSGDSEGDWDVFVHDRIRQRTILASQSTAGTIGDGTSVYSAFSADNRTLVFVSLATNLAPADTNAQADTFVRFFHDGPSPRFIHAMAYDSARGVTVLFGGYDSNGFNGETWEWNGSTWTQRIVTGPTSRYGQAMSFDSARGVTVLCGGRDGYTSFDGETWEWNGSAWTLRSTGVGPSPRADHAMAYDSDRGRTVLFGGSSGGPLGDETSEWETWEWDGSAWSVRANTGPSPRVSLAMAYDGTRGVTVLFGGWYGSYNGETWEWDGSGWTLAAASGPSPRDSHALAYDSAQGVTVLFGGYDGAYNGETWEWDGSTWTLVAATGPSARIRHALAYDSARGVTVLFGGLDSGGRDGETWEWNGSAWTLRATTGPSPREQPAMAYDSARGVTVLFGGWDIMGPDGETWEWNGTTWTLVATGPSPRSRHAMAYDSLRRATVLFGGNVGLASVPDSETWEYGMDCNGNDVPDGTDIAAGTSQDCQPNGIPDECDIADGTSEDCEFNGTLDECDIAADPSLDCPGFPNGVIDICEPDCQSNGLADSCEIASGAVTDCNLDGTPDDECQYSDCNSNGTNDVTEICDGLAAGAILDCTGDLVLDECQPEPDCDCDGLADFNSICFAPAIDADLNGIPDGCELIPPPLDPFPVTFSVRGPVNPHVVGIIDPPGSPWATYTRAPGVIPASGVPTFQPGDVNDYLLADPDLDGTPSLVPCEAELFQSEPDLPPAGPPAGTNNQILVANALGLVAGLPAEPWHDDVDAMSWANDYLGVGKFVGPFGPTLPTAELPWEARLPYPDEIYVRPDVLFDLGTSFRLSWDDWSVGLPGTDLALESGAGDDGGGIGPWSSPPACLAGVRPDGAGGDVFATPVLLVPPPPGPGNFIAHDERALGLKSPSAIQAPPTVMEDDLDALETVGVNCVPWDCSGAFLESGNLHGRVIDNPLLPPIPLGAPGVMNHMVGASPPPPSPFALIPPVPFAPIFFSVTRNSVGRVDSAVHTQYVTGTSLAAAPPAAEEQAADIYIGFSYTDPTTGLPGGSNLLFVDEAQIGVMPHDNLDALILMVSGTDTIPGIKAKVPGMIAAALAGRVLHNGDGSIDSDGVPDDFYDHYRGFGYTTALTFPVADQEDPDEFLKIGFSVDSASIGLWQSAVDYEARGLGENAGAMQQCGDIYYSEGNPLFDTNYLWYEEAAIGGSPGAWVFPASGDLSLRADELDGLDSIEPDSDLDDDDDVDEADFALLASSFTGPLPGLRSAPCEGGDIDCDTDVDLRDFGFFQRAFGQ